MANIQTDKTACIFALQLTFMLGHVVSGMSQEDPAYAAVNAVFRYCGDFAQHKPGVTGKLWTDLAENLRSCKRSDPVRAAWFAAKAMMSLAQGRNSRAVYLAATSFRLASRSLTDPASHERVISYSMESLLVRIFHGNLKSVATAGQESNFASILANGCMRLANSFENQKQRELIIMGAHVALLSGLFQSAEEWLSGARAWPF